MKHPLRILTGLRKTPSCSGASPDVWLMGLAACETMSAVSTDFIDVFTIIEVFIG